MKAEVTNAGVLLDGKPVRILSGEIHYFRIHPDYWEDRLRKLKACGLNSVATYVPWNLHEPQPGEFVFEGLADIGRFLETAGKLGLHVFLRPGPYICSEWEFGGFPAWLLNVPDLRLRCSNPPYLQAVKRYFDALFERIKPWFCAAGGPVIAVQLENGYASFGNDIVYMKALKEMVLSTGFDGILFTSDGDSDTRLVTEPIEGVWKTLMLGDQPEAGLAVLKRQQPDLPPMISEFWDGQCIRSGSATMLRDNKVLARDLDTILASGAHVNLYMFHGGTNFGLMNGGLKFHPSGWHEPFVTSYDTQAPLSEAGDPTPKYHALREVIARHSPDFDANSPVPLPSPKRAYGEVELTRQAPLLDNLQNLASSVTLSPCTRAMEALGQNYGLILYRTRLRHQKFAMPVSIEEPRDQATVFLDGKRIAAFNRNDRQASVTVSVPEEGATLDILVENMGRYNFFWHMEDNRKGITKGVVINNQQFQHGWEIFTLPLDDLSKLAYGPAAPAAACPAFFSGTFRADKVADTFLRVTPGSRGICWINGFNLGRYDNRGPQFTLYVPAPLLAQGENRIEILELNQLAALHVELLDQPEL